MNYTSVLLYIDIRQDTFCNLLRERERENDQYALYHNIKDDQRQNSKKKKENTI